MILCTLYIIICKCVMNVLEAETKHMYDNNNNTLSKMSTWHKHILIYYYVFDVIIVTNWMQRSVWASALDYIYVVPVTLQRMYIVKGYRIKSTVFASTCEFIHINLTFICCKLRDVNLWTLIICTRKYKWWKAINKSMKKS